MGVVTWKNIAPSNPAGILSAANQAAKTMGEGFSGVGTALQSGVDKKVQSETDQFVADLMSLGTQEERDAMIGEAEGGWLNLDTINKTNYELGAPARAKLAMEEEAATKHHFATLLQGIKHEDDLEILTNTPRKSSSSSSSTIGSDRTADEKKGIFNPTNKIFTELEEADEGILDSWTAFGSDYGSNAQQKVQTFNNKFLTTYGNDISEEDLNVAFNTGILRWEDDYSTDNDFYFELDGKTVGINNKNAATNYS